MVIKYENFFYNIENLEKIAVFLLGNHELFPIDKFCASFKLTEKALNKLNEELYLRQNPNDKAMKNYKKSEMIEINIAGVTFNFTKELDNKLPVTA